MFVEPKGMFIQISNKYYQMFYKKIIAIYNSWTVKDYSCLANMEYQSFDFYQLEMLMVMLARFALCFSGCVWGRASLHVFLSLFHFLFCELPVHKLCPLFFSDLCLFLMMCRSFCALGITCVVICVDTFFLQSRFVCLFLVIETFSTIA